MTDSHSETHEQADIWEKLGDASFSIGRPVPIALLTVGLGLTFFFGLNHLLSFESLRENRDTYLGWLVQHYALSTAAFVVLYAAAAAIWLTIASGFRFDGKDVGASSIYKWFSEDFGDNDREVLDHIRTYAPPSLRAKLKNVTRISN